jgi:hypothetical protein
MTKHPPTGFVVLCIADFDNDNYEPRDEMFAILIPRSEVATLNVSAAICILCITINRLLPESESNLQAAFGMVRGIRKP